jgi:hypothetical protein
VRAEDANEVLPVKLLDELETDVFDDVGDEADAHFGCGWGLGKAEERSYYLLEEPVRQY